MKILIISKEYWPISNGTVTCLSNLIQEMIKNHSVHLITVNPDQLRLQSTEMSFKVTTLSNYGHLHHRFIRYLEKTIKKGFFFQLLFWLSYLIFGIHAYTNEKKWLKAGQKIPKFVNLAEIDWVISIAMPYSNVQLVAQLKNKNPDLQIAHILFDLYADNPVWIKEKSNKEYVDRLNKEKEWFNQADAIFTTQEMIASYLPRYREMQHKLIEIGLPMIYPISVHQHINFDSNQINLVYTGSFYSQLRSGQDFIKFCNILFEAIPKLHVYVFGNSQFNVNEESINSRMHFMGLVSKDIALSALNEANGLINISNASHTQIPSKLYEYISSGKPIINLKSIENDVCESILKKYTHSISLDVSQLNDQATVDKLVTFIHQYKNDTLSFSSVSQDYQLNLPKTSAQMILTTCERGLKI